MNEQRKLEQFGQFEISNYIFKLSYKSNLKMFFSVSMMDILEDRRIMV